MNNKQQRTQLIEPVWGPEMSQSSLDIFIWKFTQAHLFAFILHNGLVNCAWGFTFMSVQEYVMDQRLSSLVSACQEPWGESL